MIQFLKHLLSAGRYDTDTYMELIELIRDIERRRNDSQVPLPACVPGPEIRQGTTCVQPV